MEIIVQALNQAKMRINSAQQPDEINKIYKELQNLKTFIDFFHPEQDVFTSEINNLSEGLLIVMQSQKKKIASWESIKEKSKKLNIK